MGWDIKILDMLMWGMGKKRKKNSWEPQVYSEYHGISNRGQFWEMIARMSIPIMDQLLFVLVNSFPTSNLSTIKTVSLKTNKII